MDKRLTKISKFLSLILRHQPEAIGLALEPGGWLGVEALIAAAGEKGVALTRELLEQVVEQNEKRRFALSEDGSRIRASQGHSVEVDLGLEPTRPPDRLYHGTATRFLESIRREGLRPGRRQHVHLSLDIATATAVGQRHGKPAVLTIDARAMDQQGFLFYLSANGVWLTGRVPQEVICFPES